MVWQWLPFGGLSARQLHDMFQLRQRVFVVEQKCPYLDIDGVDPQCWHGLGYDNGVLVATSRIVPPGLKYAEPAIGRVVSAPEVRRKGVGRELMVESIAQLRRLYPGQAIKLSAQRYLEAFYASLGFAVAGEPYDEDGIPHIDMIKE